MASSFMGLYVQRDALNIAQKSLDIVGNNISNIKTAGYTRQRVDVCSVGYAKTTLGYNNTVELSGKGAEAVGVAQLRDRVADKHVRDYSGMVCDSGAKVDALGKIEDIFDSIEKDTRDTDGNDLGVSFASIVSKFKNALHSYSTDDADRSVMANNALNEAKSLVECINKYFADIDKVSETVITDTRTTVDRINQIFEEMGSLNKEIKDAYISMGYFTTDMDNYRVQSQYGPLELKDKMNLLLDELSQYGNIDVTEEKDGTYTVKFANNICVMGKYYAQMAMSEFNPRPTEMGFVLSCNNDHFKPELDAKGNVIDAYGSVDKDVDYRIRGLKDKDEWYKLNKAIGTGGDAQVLLRSEEYQGKLLNVTGGADGREAQQYLNTGSLRGLLDVYNGRGTTFADAAGVYENVNQQAAAANEALYHLANYNLNPGDYSYGEVCKLKDTIETAIGADVVKNDDGTYTVTLNNKELVSAAGDYKQLIVDADPTKDYAHLTIAQQKTNADGDPVYWDADGNETTDATAADGSANAPKMEAGEVLREIYSNKYQGIEYYRDLLNSFVGTMTAEFNNEFRDIDVTVNTAEYINSYAMQLDEYNHNPTDSTLTKEDVQKIISRLEMAGAVVTGDDGEYKVEYTDANSITYTIVSGGKTGTTLDKLDPDALPDVNKTAVLEGYDYELFVYNQDSFRTAALDMRIGEDWLNRPEIIADPANNNDYEELQNARINRLLGVFGTSLDIWDDFGHKVETKHTPEDFVDYICSDVGSRVSLESAIYENADIQLGQYEDLRSGVMDVSMEEEGVDMLNFQKWYSAISRMVTAMDELLDKLINNTGIVGLR
ncbi:MAG: flagellar basal body protein [Ruminococcus sp.]|nr:flagellar basal body protein [Ruminococcus sp.]MCM1380654.1 flagellar basal body protein [Muribaculaceae bacterium]MCM1479486.1 flagellar basal body protein [Muribaculaceae bacterium]